MSSRYNPIRETFTSNPICNLAPLATKTTPPGGPPNDLIISGADFNSASLWPTLKSPSPGNDFTRRIKFDRRDIPHVVGMGIFGNMADCITPINEPCDHGLTILLRWDAFKSDDSFYRTISARYLCRFESLNAIFDYDIFLIDEAQATDPVGGVPTFPNGRLDISDPNIAYTALFIEPKRDEGTGTVDYSTILLDPRFGTKNFMLWGNFVVEHTFQMLELNLPDCDE